MAENRRTVEGSERAPVPGARVVGPVAADAQVEVTLRLRPANAEKARRLYAGEGAPRAVSRDKLQELVGAANDDVAVVEEFAHQHGMTVLEASPERRTVRLRGPAAVMQEAFGVQLQQVENQGRSFRQREGTVQLPAKVQEVVTGVFGLDDRPQARPHFRLGQPAGGAGGGALTAAVAPRAAGTSYLPPQLAAIYHFPTGVNGTGQTIALIELGGGYRTADLNAYAATLKVKPFTVVAVGVDGGHNAPTGNPNSADGEVVLDIEVAAGVAPAATVVVYFAPNTDAGFIDAVSAAVHDKVHHPQVISISWGGPENAWTAQARNAFNEVLTEAAAAGIPVFVAAGDDGASDGEPGKHVDFPASAPRAIACGGTRLAAANGKRTAETVWNDLPNGGATGGGFSAVFAAPAWQLPVLHGNKMRGVPDVSADADPVTGYIIRVDGTTQVIGGTSAVAPLMAGLVALCNQKAGTGPGQLVQKLYAAGSPSGAFFDVTQGSNGGFNAGVGWDACTGLGVPAGTAFLNAGWGAKKAPKKVQVSSIQTGEVPA